MIVDAALVLIDGAGNSNVQQWAAPTSGGYDNLAGYVTVVTTGTTGTVKLQESSDNSTYTDVAGASVTFTAAGNQTFVLPKTTKKYLKAVLSSASGDNLTTSNTTVVLGAKNYIKEI